MEIIKLSLFTVPGYQPIHQRSYKTIVDQYNLNLLEEVTQGGAYVNQGTISKIASNFVQPAAETGHVTNIVNGWHAPRYRFILETKEYDAGGNSSLAFYIGHTDRQDDAVSVSGFIAPDLQFYINACHRVKISQVQQNGVMSQRTSIFDSSQILYGDGTAPDLSRNQLGTMVMRPQEVFKAQNTLNILEKANLIDSNIIDARAAMISTGEKNNRRNNAPGTYLYDILKSYQFGAEQVRESGYDATDIAEQALGNLDNTSLYYDNLFSMMRAVAYNIQENGRFTYHDLNLVCPHIDQITIVGQNTSLQSINPHIGTGLGNTVDTALNNQWNSGNTSHWHGSDMETITAALLAQAVPTIMLENLVGALRLHITNNTLDGSVTMNPLNVHMLTQSIQATHLLQRVMDRIRVELLPGITMQNSRMFDILIDSSVTGDTMVNVSFDGKPAIPYVMPTFADNIASPVLTADKYHFDQTVHGLYSIGEKLFGHRVAGQVDILTSPNAVIAPQSPMLAPTSNNNNNGLW